MTKSTTRQRDYVTCQCGNNLPLDFPDNSGDHIYKACPSCETEISIVKSKKWVHSSSGDRSWTVPEVVIVLDKPDEFYFETGRRSSLEACNDIIKKLFKGGE